MQNTNTRGESLQQSFESGFEPYPSFEEQPIPDSLELQRVPFATDNQCVPLQNGEVYGQRARKSTQVAHAHQHGEILPELHSVRINQLKREHSGLFFRTKDIADIQIAVEDACPMDMVNKSSQLVKQTFLDVCIKRLSLNQFHDRTIIRIEREEVTYLQNPVASLLDKGHLFGRINSQITQSHSMQMARSALLRRTVP